jgi:hypothetical protein
MMVNVGPMANRATLRPGRIVAYPEVIHLDEKLAYRTLDLFASTVDNRPSHQLKRLMNALAISRCSRTWISLPTSKWREPGFSLTRFDLNED